MTQVADFLLQPATGRAGLQPGAPVDSGRALPGTSGQDFSRILVQQKQVVDTPASAPREPVARREQPSAEPARKDKADSAKPVQQPKERQDAKVDAKEEAGDSAPIRQKADVEDDRLTADPAEEAVEGEGEITLLPPGLLNPLLEQIRQADAGEEELEGMAEVVEGAEVVHNLLALIEGSPMHSAQAADNGIKLTAGTQTSAVQQVSVATAGQAGNKETALELSDVAEDADTEELLLELEAVEGDELVVGSQLLSAAGARRENADVQGTSQTVRVTGAGEARTDTLMRSEAVQSSQAARSVPGQPLNMQQPGWSKELTDKVMWMSSQNLKSAEIKMNPAELGRLEIRVQMGQEQTQITFASAHAGVRDSLDGQMHRLREMLEQQGMNNVDVEVSDQSQRQQERQAEGGSAAAVEDALDEQHVATSELEEQHSGHSGLVSQYV